MGGMISIVSYGIGTVLGFVPIGALIVPVIHGVTQKKHTVLRNYPGIGQLRFFFEDLGEYFRQYFFAGDRDEMPFNRATRGRVYKEAKNEGGIMFALNCARAPRCQPILVPPASPPTTNVFSADW